MVAMLQRLDTRRFFFRPQLSVCSFLALFLKVFRNRLSCHGSQCGRTGAVKSVPFWPVGSAKVPSGIEPSKSESHFSQRTREMGHPGLDYNHGEFVGGY